MYIILVYDINVEDKIGAKVSRRVFKECKKYLLHVQNSVFEGELTEPQLFKLENSIKKIVRENLDSVIIFKTRNEKWLDRKVYGGEKFEKDNFI